VRKTERKVIIKETAIFLLFVPVAMHFAVHLSALFFKNNTLADVWRIWVFHMKYLLKLKESHTYGSKFWEWPLLLRPIWFHFKHQPDNMVHGILCIGNPAIFWVIPIVIGNLLWELIRKKSAVCGLILLGFFTQWLFPFVFMKLTFFHYFYTAMPFVVMGLGLLMMRIWRSGKLGRSIVIAYLILVAAMFVYWYPLLTGIPIPHHYYDQHLWFKSWI
jgi:dolichyl-phosphate-mannose--protein O-mannosyl transferase